MEVGGGFIETALRVRMTLREARCGATTDPTDTLGAARGAPIAVKTGMRGADAMAPSPLAAHREESRPLRGVG